MASSVLYRTFCARLTVITTAALPAIFMYQTTDAFIFYIVGMLLYVRAWKRGEVSATVPLIPGLKFITSSADRGDETATKSCPKREATTKSASGWSFCHLVSPTSQRLRNKRVVCLKDAFAHDLLQGAAVPEEA